MSTHHSSVGQPADQSPSNKHAKASRSILHLPAQNPGLPQAAFAAVSQQDAVEKKDATQAKDINASGVANFASSEIAGVSETESNAAAREKSVGAAAAPDPKQGTTAKSIVNPDQQAAIDRCKAVRTKSGPITKTSWSPKSVEMLSASLEFVNAFGGDEKALDAVRLMLKAEGSRNRALNKGNVELIGLHLCLLPQNKGQRKEWSRFASVVRLAVHQKTAPSDAEIWLKQRTLSAAVAEARALSERERTASKRIAPPISKNNRPTIWKALTSDDSALRAMANAALDELEKNLLPRLAEGNANA